MIVFPLGRLSLCVDTSSSFVFVRVVFLYLFFFFNDTATTEIYTLSLHDALPIWPGIVRWPWAGREGEGRTRQSRRDRKSTRLNSSHRCISYAVFCLKKKKKKKSTTHIRQTKDESDYSHRTKHIPHHK